MTQRDVILDHLVRRGPLTPLKALHSYGCFRLAARILELRQAGHKIEREWGRTPNGKRIAIYFYMGGPKDGRQH